MEEIHVIVTIFRSLIVELLLRNSEVQSYGKKIKTIFNQRLQNTYACPFWKNHLVPVL